MKEEVDASRTSIAKTWDKQFLQVKWLKQIKHMELRIEILRDLIIPLVSPECHQLIIPQGPVREKQTMLWSKTWYTR